MNFTRKDARSLKSWYKHLPARHVDLVGDYAGNELFVIHGESILLHCFENDDIDFDSGFQLLHAAHAVEAFLFGLVQRKCNFHIVFFDEHESLCIPEQAAPENHHKYTFARAAIIRHLQVHLPKAQPQIKVGVYKSYYTPAFKEYLSKSGVYFVMCHDGASKFSSQSLPSTTTETQSSVKTAVKADDHAGDDYDSEDEVSESDSDEDAASDDDEEPTEETNGNFNNKRLMFRSMIYWFARQGHYLALINGLQWQDTKVFTMVLEGTRRSHQNIEETLAWILTEQESTHAGVQEPHSAVRHSEVPSGSESNALMVDTLRIMLATEKIHPQAAQALVVHSAILRLIPLSSRRVKAEEEVVFDQETLQSFTTQARAILRDPECSQSHHHDASTDIADFIDGRILNHVFQKLNEASGLGAPGQEITSSVNAMLEAIASDGGPNLDTPLSSSTNKAPKGNGKFAPSSRRSKEPKPMSLLPFTSSVFDAHLASVHVAIDDGAGEQLSNARARVFRDLTHWHNTRPILPRTVNEKQKQKDLRNNQFFMREMTQYAASLTNAVGKILEPEIIITGQETKTAAPVSSSKAAKMVAENLAVTARKNEKKFLESWKLQIKEFDLIPDLEKRYIRAKAFLDILSGERKIFLQAEVEMYLLNVLLHFWSATCRDGKQAKLPQTPAMIFDYLNRFAQNNSVTKTMHTKLEATGQSLGLPYLGKDPGAASDRPLSFSFILAKSPDRTLKISETSRNFQLSHCGPYFDRSIGSSEDDRVRFKPDAWQRRVLDVLDENKSVFVVAPTSAGKTFISFYAMKQILKADDDGVLVYVAPTKALVNQIAAELQANFSKKFKHGGKSVWAIHTRDYRVNNTTGCQVLVTLPHILQIMLMSPENARSWAPRVKRIIFDEIHSIGQAEDGLVWEQLLLLAPCPIIALSATVGNPSAFSDWLVSTQKSLGFEMVMISHPYRYSDLRKYIYQPPTSFQFSPIVAKDTIGLASLDGAPQFAHLHPVATLSNEARGMPEDLHLEPKDCLSLWESLKKHSSASHPIDSKVDPATALPEVIRKIDIINWENSLKAVLKTWMADSNSPFKAVLADLSKPIEKTFRAVQFRSVSSGNQGPEKYQVTTRKSDENENSTFVDQADLLSTTLPLLVELDQRNALPALLFNYDRTMCEKICKNIMKQLIAAETHWKETSLQWQEKLKGWERWKLLEAKKPKKAAAKSKKKGGKDDDDDGNKSSKADNERDNAEGEQSPFASFNPDEPQEGFHFADNKKMQRSELDEILWKLKRRHIAEWLMDALLRGIGVHHAGMNRAYRQAVETLFRRGFLRCVVATGTLALGINMPCRTVVFSGDSIFLTALNYRQAAGRAGRRGFDLLGNVVFQNIPTEKVCRLVSSRLPDLNGHFPITTSLVLRLFILLSESKNSRYAERAVESLLSQPRLYLGGPSFKDQVLHHLRFSIEYLRRQHLLSRNGTPLNFAGCISHLYFTEQSSFAFHALLKDGYFHTLCKNMTKKSEPRILDTLMLVMSHLFGRRPCRQADQEFLRKKVRKSSSMIFLPALPAPAMKILREHNDETLKIFTTYVKTFAAQHLADDDNKLPLSGMTAGGGGAPEALSFLDSLPPTSIRSAFSALSGHGDKFGSVSELCRSARDGVFLEESVIPHVTLYPDDAKTPLNAYLYDYFRHGDVRALAEDNGVRRGDVWFLLNDFSLVLATIVTSFRNYLNLSDLADSDVLDAAGGGDMHEVEEDDRLAEEAEKAETASSISKTSTNTKASMASLPTRGKENVVVAPVKKKKKVIDSWDDEDIPSSSSEEESETFTGGQSTPATSMGPAWEEESGESLLKVLKAFEKLKGAFDEKFKAMWA